MKKARVYLIDTSAPGVLPEAVRACLPPAERERAQALRQPQDRLNRQTAYAVLFWLAARQAGCELEALAVERDAHGKPRLRLPASAPALHFNISHSGACVALALSSQPVGVDIEHIRPIDWQPLLRDHFPQDRLPRDEDPASSFFRLWTAKEAVLKAAGTGLAVSLADIALPEAGPGFQPLRSFPPGLGLDTLGVRPLETPPGYRGAIAMRQPFLPVSIQRLAPNAMLRSQKFEEK